MITHDMQLIIHIKKIMYFAKSHSRHETIKNFEKLEKLRTTWCIVYRFACDRYDRR